VPLTSFPAPILNDSDREFFFYIFFTFFITTPTFPNISQNNLSPGLYFPHLLLIFSLLKYYKGEFYLAEIPSGFPAGKKERGVEKGICVC